MYPYLAHIGLFPIRSYSILFLSAYLLGLGVTITLAKLKKKDEFALHIMNMAVPLLVGALVFSRIWQVFFFEPAWYFAHPSEMIKIWHGGLSIQGGIVGALLVGIWYIRRHKLPFWEMADLCAPGMVLGQSIGRDANLMNGDAFGDPTGGNFGLLYPEGSIARNQFGDKPLWPAEVWEGQMDVIIFAILMLLMQKKLKKGYLFLIYNCLYNIGRYLLEMLRGDSPRYLFHWTAAQWTSVPVIVLSILLAIYLAFRKDRGDELKAETYQD